MTGLAILAIALAAFALYMFPALVAWLLKNPQTSAITVLKLLLGWTALGWVVALVWAFIVTKEQRTEHGQTQSNG